MKKTTLKTSRLDILTPTSRKDFNLGELVKALSRYCPKTPFVFASTEEAERMFGGKDEKALPQFFDKIIISNEHLCIFVYGDAEKVAVRLNENYKKSGKAEVMNKMPRRAKKERAKGTRKMKTLTLEKAYTDAKESYRKLGYGADSWQWIDEGQVYAILDYLSSCAEFTEADLAFADKEGIRDLCDEALKIHNEEN